MTTAYVYPFSEFVRDLEATRQPVPDSAERDFITNAREIIDYMKQTYSDETDRIERAAAIGTVSSYLSRNMDHFDTGMIAVRGPSCSLVSDHLLRAIHWLVVPVGLMQTDNSPDAATVLALAQSFEEHAKIEKNAEQADGNSTPYCC